MSFFGSSQPTESGVPATPEQVAEIEEKAAKAVPADQRLSFKEWVKANVDGLLAAAGKTE